LLLLGLPVTGWTGTREMVEHRFARPVWSARRIFASQKISLHKDL
jgi:hypothetical protein